MNIFRSAHQHQISRASFDKDGNLIEPIQLMYEIAVELSILNRISDPLK